MIAGVDGPCLLISAETAAWLERYAKLTDLRVRVRGVPGRERVSRELTELREVALHYRRPALPEAEAAFAEVAPGSEQWVGSVEAADLLGISDRAVRLACTDGRLGGEQVGGRWRIPREAIDEFAAQKTA